MPQYVFAYHGGEMPKSPEAAAKLMDRWKAWMAELGDGLVNPGAPVGISKTVSAKGVSEGGGANPISGYSVVEAGSMDAALKMAMGCPHLDSGTIEVAEVTKMG